jgi:ADP-heptose:LPS heptosyltransferase
MMQSLARPVLLVLRHHGLGDLVTVQPALKGLRTKFPEHSMVVTCPSWLLPLAKFFRTADLLVSEVSHGALNPVQAVDPCRHRDADTALLRNVMNEVVKADVLVSLRTPGPELLPLIEATRPALLVSYRYQPLAATHRYPDLDFSDHILDRWRRLLSTIGVEPSDGDLYVDLRPASAYCGYTIVHAGAGSPARIWPLQQWTVVVRHLVSRGHRVLLTGSTEEASRVNELRRAAGLPPECDRCGATDVMELAQLIAGARLVVCVDSGVSHLATAFRRPALTLFGPLPPAWWGPPPGNPQHRTIWTGRTGDTYAGEVDPGLMEISAEAVVDMIERLHAEEVRP